MVSIMKNCLIAAVAVLGCNLAHADAKNFEGLSANIGAYAVNSSITSDLGGGNTVDGLGKGSYAVDVSVDYGIALSSDTVLLLGGSYGLSDPTAFNVDAGGLEGSLKAGKRMSLFAAPGVLLSDKVLAYGKLAYVSTKPNGTGDFAFGSSAKTHSGFGYGGGVRILLSPNTYVNLEAMNNDYGSKTYDDGSIGAKALFAGVALGYKF
jgi:opacity protein-like surface antigen